MSALLLDTNIVSILFNRSHTLRQTCLDAVAGHRTCALWAEIIDQCRRAGQSIQAADAWIASAALQWNCPLVTTDFRDYAAISGLDVVPIRQETQG